jgi:ankyrin repeat protein
VRSSTIPFDAIRRLDPKVTGSDGVALALIEDGADLDHTWSKGETALHVAVRVRSASIVRALLKKDRPAEDDRHRKHGFALGCH